MRLSVWPRAGQPWPDIAAVARLAEHMGWNGVWFGDHGPGALECWTVLAGLAAVVPRIRLGAFTHDDCRPHPAVLAKLAATVDQLSGGRIVLGLVVGAGAGAGGTARLAETCAVLAGLTDNQRVTFEGRFFQLREAPLEPKPVQRPLPLLLCSQPGDQEIERARLAARYARYWHTTGTPEQVRNQVELLRRCCVELGRDRGDIAVSVRATPAAGGREWQYQPLVADYADAGIDELIVADDEPGPSPGKIDRLARIMALMTAARDHDQERVAAPGND